MELTGTSNNLVAYSRAGDVFHYRWAARRCLRLIQPTSNLESVFIERSNESKRAGEYVIDVSEYYGDDNSKKRIEYFQLKHTTVQHDKPFTLSALKDTIVGFSDRYRQHLKEKSISGISFTIITNRKIEETFKQNVASIAAGGDKVNKRFSQTLKKYTNLEGKELFRFCGLLNLADSEGDYKDQEEDLRIEMSRLQPGSIDPAQVDSIVSLVQKKVLPDSNGKIIKEDILRPFGVTSPDQLFPARPLFEDIENITSRGQYSDLLNRINNENQPVIIQAAGGVGKTVFSQYVLQALPEGSLGIAYDCFGSGTYRRPSKPRHRHREALVQIANELASLGFCDRLIIKDTTHSSDIMRDFIRRIESSLKSLKQIIKSSHLYILIDAADNAEMAAQEFGDSCFAHELLREEFPQDCKLIYLCRPERTHLLKPTGSIPILNLQPFSKEETLENLKKWFPQVTESQAFEFHRLTSGNPRVQMNSITAGQPSVNELLSFLGPSGTNVEEQIEQQLNTAIQKIKNALGENYQPNVEKICTGLASLPPNIPIKVLSKASEVKIEDVKSFVADIGRSLWLLDSSVQFRDEPTETWFRNTFLGSKKNFGSYIKALEPLASEFTYVAEILPQLYLQAGQYNELIRIALSDKLLPAINPIDIRNVLVYRLQFAFKAALRLEEYKDAIQLALRAGEEVAGDQRQQSLFQDNIDLLPKLQDKLKVQEIAFKKLLRSGWEGSENVYTASLLSEIEEYQGEAHGYLRSALNWLHIYFEESKRREDRNHENGVSFDDILELGLVHLNLNGAKPCLKFLNSIKPKESILEVLKRLISRLIDADRFEEIGEILKNASSNKYHVVGIVSELAKVGRFAETNDIEECLDILSNPNKRIKKPKDQFNDDITPSIIAFLEVCLHRKMNSSTITRALDYYAPKVANQGVGSRFESKERITYLKALSIRVVISKDSVVNLNDLMPEVYKSEDRKRDYADDIKEFKEVIGGLFPWYLLRAQLISGGIDNLSQAADQASEDSKKAYTGRYRSYDVLPNEIADILSSILVYCGKQKSQVIQQFYNHYLQDNSSFIIPQRINLLRAGIRSNHFSGILPEIENSTYELIKGLKDARPEEMADDYISLARAVLSSSKDDAAVYFEDAIDIVSKFGDEIVERWEAIASLGERSATIASDELAYRFIRCAELVGEYVYREKHWDRDEAFVTCTKMSPQIGISALSRWRDRKIGRFEYQLESMLDYLVRCNAIDPTEGWSMARFISYHHLKEFLSTCLANEPSNKSRNSIFNDAYDLVRKEGANYDYWIQMKSLADKYEISNKDLDSVLGFYKDQINKAKASKKKQRKKTRTKSEIKKWERIFYNLEFLKPEGLETLTDRYSSEFNNEDSVRFWRTADLYNEALNRIEASDVYKFIELLLSSEKVSHFDLEQVLSSIPDDLKRKVSFKKKWPKIIKRFGTRYAHELVNAYTLRSSIRELDIDDDLTTELRKGIFQGISQGQEFVGASILFEFAQHASTFINEEDACVLTDYALSRFELHIEKDFGDGPWSEWLHVSNDMNRNIAGFIWSALGAPQSKSRWNACHAVKKLADFNCTKILDSLIEWLEHDKVDAFGSNQYSFYNLHARQYLLIALCRVSVDRPGILVSYKRIFLKYAQIEPHILIQKFAAEIALNIEKAIPGTYISKETSSLKVVGKGKHETRKEEYRYQVDSYLHQRGEVDTAIDYHFAHDFDRYWYEPLGRVFGVTSKQIQDLCANVIVNEWKLGTKTGYNNDPRLSLWNSSHDRETWHSHSSYPKTDNWDFYLSYHSMFVVASKLLENMPIIISEDYWDEDPWNYWLSHHILSRGDGKWLADDRGKLPLQRPEWITKDDKDEKWRTDIQEQDFLNSIKVQYGKETWLNIKGGWTETHNSRYETYSVSASLVSKTTSDALMRALTGTSNYHDYKLPDFEESRVEIDSDIFRLEGFILNAEKSKGIDEFDPNGGNISYPQISLGEPFNKELDLLLDSDGRTWCFSDGEVALKCNSWSGNLQGYDEEPQQSGMRLSASLAFLKKLCQVYDSHIIIDVNVNRDIEYKYRSDKAEYEYLTHHKIYLFAPDGRLRSTEENYRLR